MAEETSKPDNFVEGFTQIPHWVLNTFLCLDISQRGLKLVLLIARLSYGCLNHKWIKLRKADLQIIGISPTHAKQVLETAIKTQVILQNERTGELKINEEYLQSKEVINDIKPKLDRLRKVVGKQLQMDYQKGNDNVTKIVTPELPNREASFSQKGNPYTFPKRKVSASNKSGFTPVIDTLIDNINSDRYGIADKTSSSGEDSHE